MRLIPVILPGGRREQPGPKTLIVRGHRLRCAHSCESDDTDMMVVRWLRLIGFARGPLRRKSDRAEVGIVFAGLAGTAAAVPIGAEVESLLLTEFPIPDQASVLALLVVIVWLAVVLVTYRAVSRVLERRRIDSWGEQ